MKILYLIPSTFMKVALYHNVFSLAAAKHEAHLRKYHHEWKIVHMNEFVRKTRSLKANKWGEMYHTWYVDDLDEFNRENLPDFDPDLILVSHLFSFNHHNAASLVKECRKKWPDTFIACGGSAISCEPEITSGMIDADLFGYSDGEKPIEDLVLALSKSRQEALDLDKTHSSWFTHESVTNGKKLKATRMCMSEVLDDPVYDLTLQTILTKGQIPLDFRLGCNCHCSFCFTNDRVQMGFSMERAKRFVDSYADFGVTEIALFDDEPFTNELEAKEIIEYTNSKGIKVLPFCFPLSMTLNRNVLGLVKDQYITDFQIPLYFDSGCDRVHRDWCRKIDHLRMRERCDMIQEYGFRSLVKCLVGYPDETKDEIVSIIPQLQGAKYDSFVLGVVQPLPGTRLRRVIDEKNLWIKPFNYDWLITGENDVFISTEHWDPKWLDEETRIIQSTLGVS